MTPLLFVALALAGGLGATSRLLLDGILHVRLLRRPLRRWVHRLPVGTIVINLSGSLLLGLLTGWVARGTLGEGWAPIAGSGFLGGYTTFSSSSFETVRLLQEGEGALAALNGLGLVAAATAAAAMGLWIGMSA